jgi:uncharacterized Zn-finger protein
VSTKPGQLQAIARTLSTAASQLIQEAAETEDDERGVSAALVRHSVQHIYGVLSLLQDLIGSPLSVDEFLAIKSRVEALGKQLAAAAGEVEPGTTASKVQELGVQPVIHSVAEEVESLRLQLQSAVARKDRRFQPETVQCPRCKNPVPTVLGSLGGDSVAPTCPICGTRFHAHRAADGTVFTRPWGGALKTTVSIEVACPHCGKGVPLNVPRASVTPQIRFCLSCFAKLEIDPQTKQVKLLREPQEPLTGKLSTDGSYLLCPRCNQSCRCRFDSGGVFFAVCEADDNVVRATVSYEKAATTSTGDAPARVVGPH